MGRLVFLGLGAALMYLMDPQAGRKRRADLRNSAEATGRRLREARVSIEHGRMPDIDTERALAGSLGTGLAMGGYARGGAKGLAMFLLGVGFLARAASPRGIAALARGEGIPVQKTIRIDRPVADVFAYWRNLENLPLWMSHVQEVRYLGGDRYHWKVDGPEGVPVEWDAELLNVVANGEMTWRSVEGSTVHNTGRVRFEEDGDGTRVHVLVRSQGNGVDPARAMDEDLARLKSLVENGRSPPDSVLGRPVNGGAGLGAAPA
jgi:uncharacterized membrane protein